MTDWQIISSYITRYATPTDHATIPVPMTVLLLIIIDLVILILCNIHTTLLLSRGRVIMDNRAKSKVLQLLNCFGKKPTAKAPHIFLTVYFGGTAREIVRKFCESTITMPEYRQNIA